MISLIEDPAGTLKVKINFKGKTYELVKAGFNKLSLKTEANKFQDFASTDTIKSNAASLKATSKDVLNLFKKISGYQRPTNLTSDIVITKVIVKKSLNQKTQKMTFELTISRQEEEVKKDVTVTFKKEPSGLSTGAIVGMGLGAIFGIGIISFLIFYLARRNKK